VQQRLVQMMTWPVIEKCWSGLQCHTASLWYFSSVCCLTGFIWNAASWHHNFTYLQPTL